MNTRGIMSARFGVLTLLLSVLASCATPERKLLATRTSLAHHEHLRRLEGECRLKQSGVDTFEFQCKGIAPVLVRCSMAGPADCCWVVDDSEQEDRKCSERRVASRPRHLPH